MTTDYRAILRRLESWPTSVTIADASRPDCPLVYTNEAFCALTGYDYDALVGRNCRFLQGDKTDPRAVDHLRVAVQRRERISVCLLNHRSDGTPFLNLIFLAPVNTPERSNLIVGCQFPFRSSVMETEIKAQLENVEGLFQSVECPADVGWTLYVESIQVRTLATQRLVDTYLQEAFA